MVLCGFAWVLKSSVVESRGLATLLVSEGETSWVLKSSEGETSLVLKSSVLESSWFCVGT